MDRLRLVWLTGFLAVFLAAPGLGLPPNASAEEPPPLPVTHQHFNFFEGPLTNAGDGATSWADYRNPQSPICATSGSLSGSNVGTDCEGKAPHNETSIAVNPTNPLNMIGSANDYQLFLTPGGYAVESIYSRAHTSFDGGKTWTTYPIPYNGYMATGDPAVAFDAAGNAYVATLGFVWSQNRGCCTNPDILVARSADGGKTWSAPARVASRNGKLWQRGRL